MHLTDDKVRIHRKKLPLNSSIFFSAICPAFIIMLLMLSTSCNDRSHHTSQSSIDSALSSFQLPKGFKIEVLAAELLIGDPVDMEIDEYGRLYVIEMPGYPLDKSGTGKVKLLSDANGDGR